MTVPIKGKYKMKDKLEIVSIEPIIASWIKNSTVEVLKRVNKIIQKVQVEVASPNYQDLGDLVEIVLFTDVSFENLSNGGSQGGFVIYIWRGQILELTPIIWQ